VKEFIATDLDGVITDTDPVFREYIRRVTGKNFKREQVTQYFYEKCLPISKEDVDRAYELMNKENVWEKMSFVEGAKESLKKLGKNFAIFIITARPKETKEKTINFLKKNEIPFEKIFFLKEGDGKIDIIKNLPARISAFIEDRLDFAKSVALNGIRTFLFDYPWNKTEEKIPNLIRIKTWKEVLTHLFN